MSTIHAPDARPLESATENLERKQEAEKPSSSDPSTKPDQAQIPALAPSLVQALYDYAPNESGELAFKRGDLIEFLGKSDWSQWHRGKIYSGGTKGRTGIYPVNYVHGVDPTDPAFHDVLSAKLESIDGVARRVPSRSAETYPGLEDALREKPLDGVSTPPESEVPCMAYIHGVCSKGNACRFSHDLSSAGAKVCQDFAKGTCTNNACRMLHIRFPEAVEIDGKGISPKVPELRLPPQSPFTSLEPAVLGSIARQDSDIRPDLLLPGSDNIPEEWQTIDDILKNNPNYGAKTRAFVPSRSVPLQQIRENRQPTPPLPTESNDQKSGVTDEPADIQARCRQLRAQLFDAGKNDLFYTLTRSQDSTQPKTSVLSIAALQHMALHQLQYDISCYVGLMYRTSQFYMELQGFPPLTELMNKYCDAIRNLDYMKQCALRGYEEDPFLMKSSRALERSILEITQLVPNHVLPTGPLPLPKDADNPQLRDMGRNEANQAAYQKKRLLRFAMAGLGGLLLVVPMLIMANVPGKISSLVTTCIALLVFSVLITLLTELGPHEILATTAAYAAVLVVFVGTSLSAQTVVISSLGSGLSK